MPRPAIFANIDTLAALVDAGDRGVRRRWWGRMLLIVGGDFGLVYWQLVALRQQRAGESYLREAYLYAVSIVLWFVFNQRVADQVAKALTGGAKKLTDGIVERLRRLPLDKFETIGRGTLVSRLTSDAQRVANATPAVVGVPVALIRLTFGAIFAFSISPNIAAIAAFGMLVVGISTNAQVHAMREGFGAMAEDEEQTYDLLRGHVDGAIQLELHAPRAKAIGRRFGEVSDRLHARRVSLFSTFFGREHMADAMFYGILGLNVFVLPLVIPVDNESIRELNLVLVWVVAAVFGIAFLLPDLSMAAEALTRLRKLDARLDEEGQEPPPDAASQEQKRFEGFETLAVRGLRFQYPPSNGKPSFMVGPIDVTFRRGEVVFVTGHNGSGKSTFLKMLTGLYPARAGELRVDDRVIEPGDLAPYRGLFSTIFTDHHIFARTFGIDGDRKHERAAQLLEEMEISHKTSIVGGRVTNRALSTGQKKRLAMVLARLQDRPILILDEWAADQDPEFRAQFYHEILPALSAEGKLVIAVTHDDQYFHCAHRAIHFDEGHLQPSPRKRQP